MLIEFRKSAGVGVDIGVKQIVLLPASVPFHRLLVIVTLQTPLNNKLHRKPLKTKNDGFYTTVLCTKCILRLYYLVLSNMYCVPCWFDLVFLLFGLVEVRKRSVNLIKYKIMLQHFLHILVEVDFCAHVVGMCTISLWQHMLVNRAFPIVISN